MEGGDDEDFRIGLHGRYSHARAYIDRAAEVAGFAAPHIGQAVLRKEFDQPVNGYVVLAHRPETAL
jgi:predicted TPR repeat methyltransferase